MTELASPRVDSRRFRDVLGHFASGVVVIAALENDRPVGMTANSFASLSLDPPLVMFGAARSSRTWPRIARDGRFAVSILCAGQEELCWRFAARDVEERFADVAWHRSASGLPVVDDALGWLDCAVSVEYPGGDHGIVVAEVRDLGLAGGPSHPHPAPQIFYRGRLRRLTD